MTINTSMESEARTTRTESLSPCPFDTKGLMSRCLGKISFALMLLEEFESSGKRNAEKIVEHAERHESLAAAEAAHALKGTAGIIGAQCLEQLAAEIETAGRQGQTAIATDVIDKLKAEMARCLVFIPQFRITMGQPN